MAMLYTSLKSLLHDDKRRHQASDSELSVSLESIIKHLNDKTKLKEPSCVFVCGEPGCGRTTLLLDICDALLGSGLKDSEILGMRVRAGCTGQSLWNFLSEISKNKQDKDTASLLSQSTAKLGKKYKAAQTFISSNFKLVCVDDVLSDGGIVWCHLSQLLYKINTCGTTCAVVACTKKDAPFLEATLTDVEHTIHSVELKGISVDSFKKSLGRELPNWDSSDEQQMRICSMFSGNPTALKVILNTVNEFKLPPQSLDCSFLSCSEHPTEPIDCSVLRALQFSFQHLTACEKQVFGQLCQLRESLPMVNVSKEVEKLARLGLVNKEAVSFSNGGSDAIYSVSVASCLQLGSLQLSNCISLDISADHMPCGEVQVQFSAYDAWHALLSEKLRQLISDAEENAWPFVPEKW